MRSVSLFEAKTHLSNLINEVIKNQESVAISKHGHKVVMLVPIKTQHSDARNVIREMRLLSKEIGRGKITLKEILAMRDEGRK